MPKYWTPLSHPTGNAIIHATLLVVRGGLTWVNRKGKILISASPHRNVTLSVTGTLLARGSSWCGGYSKSNGVRIPSRYFFELLRTTKIGRPSQVV